MAAPAGREAPQLGQGRPRPPPELPARPPATHRNTARDHAPPPPRPPRIRPDVTSSGPHGLPGNVGPATSRLRPRLVTSEGLVVRRRRAAAALAGSASAAARPCLLPPPQQAPPLPLGWRCRACAGPPPRSGSNGSGVNARVGAGPGAFALGGPNDRAFGSHFARRGLSAVRRESQESQGRRRAARCFPGAVVAWWRHAEMRQCAN